MYLPNSIRIGIDWARIFKTSTESVDAVVTKNEKGDVYEMSFPDNFIQKMDSIADIDAVKHYVEIMEYIKAKNLKLLLTAYHWPLPIWLHDPVKCNQDFANCRAKRQIYTSGQHCRCPHILPLSCCNNLFL